MQEEKLQEINEYFGAIGYDQAHKESHLNLLASVDERYYFRYLIRTIPNIDNVNIINIVNIAMLLASVKKLNHFLSQIENNVELYLKIMDKRNSTVVKASELLKAQGFSGTSKDKLVITYAESEEEVSDGEDFQEKVQQQRS